MLFYILSASSLIYGILTLIAGIIDSSIFIISGSIIYIIIGILIYILGRNLWDKKNWARIVIMIIMGINITILIFLIPQINYSYLIELAISLLIGIYLFFNKKVKKVFL